MRARSAVVGTALIKQITPGWIANTEHARTIRPGASALDVWARGIVPEFGLEQTPDGRRSSPAARPAIRRTPD
jgi:hypothetical protein